MSLWTAGEIVVWLLLAALLGGVLGWLLRGVLRPPRRQGPTSVVIEDDAAPRRTGSARTASTRTRVAEIDTGASGTAPRPADEVFAPPSATQRAAEVARRTAGGLTPPQDDLVRIHGIGPKIAGLLTSVGITSFRQVARLNAEDIAVLTEALEIFPGRIERDDWTGSARQLHTEVYGVEP
jgi:predicted flap endonuclease-1-like 5' DNA nuclease